MPFFHIDIIDEFGLIEFTISQKFADRAAAERHARVTLYVNFGTNPTHTFDIRSQKP